MEGYSPRVSGIFFKEVVQAVLLFGAETWVMPPARAKPWGFITQFCETYYGEASHVDIGR